MTNTAASVEECMRVATAMESAAIRYGAIRGSPDHEAEYSKQIDAHREQLRLDITRLASPAAAFATVDVVFDGPPSHESGRFVECEDGKGRSINAGEWIQRHDGLWALRIRLAPPADGRLMDALAKYREWRRGSESFAVLVSRELCAAYDEHRASAAGRDGDENTAEFTGGSAGEAQASTAGRGRPVESHGVAPQQSPSTPGQGVLHAATLNVASATGVDGEQVASEQPPRSPSVGRQPWALEVTGSTPVEATNIPTARLDERAHPKGEVAGSIPAGDTTTGTRENVSAAMPGRAAAENASTETAADPATSPPLSAAAAEVARPARDAMCSCGHTFVYHETPGAECSEAFCKCGTFTPAAPVAHVHRFDDGVCRCGLEWKLMHTDPTLWAVDDGCGGVAHVRVPAAPVAREAAADPDGERVRVMAANAGLTVEEWVRQFNAAPPVTARGGTTGDIKASVPGTPSGSAIQDLCTTLIGCGHWSAPSAQLALKELAELDELLTVHEYTAAMGTLAYRLRAVCQDHDDALQQEDSLVEQRDALNEQIAGLSRTLNAAEARLQPPHASPGGAGAVDEIDAAMAYINGGDITGCGVALHLGRIRAGHTNLRAELQAEIAERQRLLQSREELNGALAKARGGVDALRERQSTLYQAWCNEFGGVNFDASGFKRLRGEADALRGRVEHALSRCLEWEKLAIKNGSAYVASKREVAAIRERLQAAERERDAHILVNDLLLRREKAKDYGLCYWCEQAVPHGELPQHARGCDKSPWKCEVERLEAELQAARREGTP